MWYSSSIEIVDNILILRNIYSEIIAFRRGMESDFDGIFALNFLTNAITLISYYKSTSAKKLIQMGNDSHLLCESQRRYALLTLATLLP